MPSRTPGRAFPRLLRRTAPSSEAKTWTKSSFSALLFGMRDAGQGTWLTPLLVGVGVRPVLAHVLVELDAPLGGGDPRCLRAPLPPLPLGVQDTAVVHRDHALDVAVPCLPILRDLFAARRKAGATAEPRGPVCRTREFGSSKARFSSFAWEHPEAGRARVRTAVACARFMSRASWSPGRRRWGRRIGRGGHRAATSARTPATPKRPARTPG